MIHPDIYCLHDTPYYIHTVYMIPPDIYCLFGTPRYILSTWYTQIYTVYMIHPDIYCLHDTLGGKIIKDQKPNDQNS